MNSFKQKLDIGMHVLSLPLDKEYKLEELFNSDLTGSLIEKLIFDGTFVNKEYL